MKKTLIRSLFLMLLIQAGCQQAPVKQETTETDKQPQSHDDFMAAFEYKNTTVSKIGFLLYDGMNALDLIGPYQVMSELMGVEIMFIGKQKGQVYDPRGKGFVVDTTFATIDSLDVLIVPGGFKPTWQMRKDTAINDWLRKIDKTTKYTASVCTGAWILSGAGLLKGKNASTHWFGRKYLAEDGVIVNDRRWTQDGKYWTSAGVSAGIDMSLAMMVDIAGPKYAQAVALDLEYAPQPPFKGGTLATTDKKVGTALSEMYEWGFSQVKNE